MLGAVGRFKHAPDSGEGTGSLTGFGARNAYHGDFSFTARATVLDDDSGAPVRGAMLQLESGSGQAIVSGVTDDAGGCALALSNATATLAAMFGNYWREESYQVTATCAGFRSSCGILICEDNAEVDVLIVMADADDV